MQTFILMTNCRLLIDFWKLLLLSTFSLSCQPLANFPRDWKDDLSTMSHHWDDRSWIPPQANAVFYTNPTDTNILMPHPIWEYIVCNSFSGGAFPHFHHLPLYLHLPKAILIMLSFIIPEDLYSSSSHKALIIISSSHNTTSALSKYFTPVNC